MNQFPSVSFAIIVLNGEPFLRYALRYLYPFAHQIIVVEGATIAASANASSDGHSIDGTLETLQHFKAEEDLENKLIIITRDEFWAEKREMSQAYAQVATGDYLWQIDVDEFYLPEDIMQILEILHSHPDITGMSFETITFWGSPKYVTDGWFLQRGAKYNDRLFKWGSDYTYANDLSLTVLDEKGNDLREQNWFDASATRCIKIYRYSLLFPMQVHSKLNTFNKSEPVKAQKFSKWARDDYDQLKNPFRVHNWYGLPSWLERFKGKHPPQFEQMWRDITEGKWPAIQTRRVDDIERVLSSPTYAIRRLFIKYLDYFHRNSFLRHTVYKLFYRLLTYFRNTNNTYQMFPINTSDDGRHLLNLGCGNRFHPSWTNIDHISNSQHVLAVDITKDLPFDDNSFDVVYHSHVIEHVKFDQARKLLTECLRVLRPNGILRVVAPDLEFSAQLYLKALEDVQVSDTPIQQEHYQWALLNLLDQMVRTQSGGQVKVLLSRPNLLDLEYIVENAGGGTILETRDYLIKHKPNPQQDVAASNHLEVETKFRRQGEVHLWMYDRYSMRQLLMSVGFEDIEHLSIENSNIDGWKDFYLDLDDNGTAFKPYSLVFEARKP